MLFFIGGEGVKACRLLYSYSASPYIHTYYSPIPFSLDYVDYVRLILSIITLQPPYNKQSYLLLTCCVPLN